ncbi:MAG: hypothetical protein H0Z34_13360 [Brevibacillus sp.]|nr:hypothetical protein [Brevibacillus sp.]
MQADAISKIKTEMNGNKNNPYIQVVGDFLLRHLETNPDDAEKIMATDKTIAGSLDAMKAEARKKQHNGVAMLTDAEGYAIVLKYFGIEGTPVTTSALATPVSAPVAAAPAASGSDFDVKLEDFL